MKGEIHIEGWSMEVRMDPWRGHMGRAWRGDT